MKRATSGFTIVELVVTMGIIGILMAVALVSWHRGGFVEEYRISDRARTVANALNFARFRALDSVDAIPLLSSESRQVGSASGEWFNQVVFTTDTGGDYRPEAGDQVMFSGLDGPHSGLNGGVYHVVAGSGNVFTCDVWFRDFSATLSVVHTQAFVKNFSTASALTIRKKSAVPETAYQDPRIVVYPDASVTVSGGVREWDSGEGKWKVQDTTAKSDNIRIRFDSRGLPASSTGYRIEFWPSGKSRDQVTNHRPLTVSPLGRIYIGRDEGE